MMCSEIEEMTKPRGRKPSKAKKLVMKPEFRMKMVGAKSGKGSYSRKPKYKVSYEY